MSDFLEVRQKMDESWIVLYPDEAFIPCAPVCYIKHKHEYEPKLVESYYKPKDYKDAKNWAEKLAEGRQIKTVKYQKRTK